MSDYLDRPVYDDIAAEARADWRAECPDDDRPTAAELADDDFDDWRWWREHNADLPDPWEEPA